MHTFVLVLLQCVIFQSVIFQSCKFQSCKFSYPININGFKTILDNSNQELIVDNISLQAE